MWVGFRIICGVGAILPIGILADGISYPFFQSNCPSRLGGQIVGFHCVLPESIVTLLDKGKHPHEWINHWLGGFGDKGAPNSLPLEHRHSPHSGKHQTRWFWYSVLTPPSFPSGPSVHQGPQMGVAHQGLSVSLLMMVFQRWLSHPLQLMIAASIYHSSLLPTGDLSSL